MKLTPSTKFIAALGLQVALILIILIFKYAVASGGTDVLLHVEPVDPKDPLRGDYVTFQYDISRIDRSRFDHEPIQGSMVYVPLEEKARSFFFFDGRVKRTLPKDSDTIYIKGVVKGTRITSLSGGSSDVLMDYGIEQYFIPEGTGRTLDFSKHTVYARVAVDNSGEAVLKQLYMDNKPWP